MSLSATTAAAGAAGTPAGASAIPGKRRIGVARREKFGYGARAAKMIKMYRFAKEIRSDQRLRRPLYSGRRNSGRSETLFSKMRFSVASCVPSGKRDCHLGESDQDGGGGGTSHGIGDHLMLAYAVAPRSDVSGNVSRCCFGLKFKQHGVTLKRRLQGFEVRLRWLEPVRCG